MIVSEKKRSKHNNLDFSEGHKCMCRKDFGFIVKKNRASYNTVFALNQSLRFGRAVFDIIQNFKTNGQKIKILTSPKAVTSNVKKIWA